jgi:hypothetical protein
MNRRSFTLSGASQGDAESKGQRTVDAPATDTLKFPARRLRR